jgi:hypothetical protein
MLADNTPHTDTHPHAENHDEGFTCEESESRFPEYKSLINWYCASTTTSQSVGFGGGVGG